MIPQTRVTEELKAEAREIVSRHLEYVNGLERGQYNMKVSNAIEAVAEALALSRTTPTPASASEELGAIAHLINVEPASMVTEEMKRAGTKVLLDIINGAGGGPEESVTAIYLAMSSMETKCEQ